MANPRESEEYVTGNRYTLMSYDWGQVCILINRLDKRYSVHMEIWGEEELEPVSLNTEAAAWSCFRGLTD